MAYRLLSLGTAKHGRMCVGKRREERCCGRHNRKAAGVRGK
jgi:hypothetical protein